MKISSAIHSNATSYITSNDTSSQSTSKIKIKRGLSQDFGNPDLVIREETLPHEKRTVIPPQQVADLTKIGYKIALTQWSERVFSKKEYKKAIRDNGDPENFVIIAPHEWKENSQCDYSYILGTKEIEDKKPGEKGFALTHRYIHFDHSYKGQTGSEKRIARLSMPTEGKPIPQLLDHEYFVDETNHRTHAFGKSAGFATTAMSILGWTQKILGQEIKLPQFSYDKKSFFEMLKPQLIQAFKENEYKPKILILGSQRGRSANGTKTFIKEMNGHLTNAEHISYDMWDRKETTSRQTENDGLEGIEHYDIILNCTYTNEDCLPFINDSTLQKMGDTLKIIGDVTCDTTKDKNRMRFSGYKTTDFDDPAFNIHKNIYAITIDHSPSLFPKEASEDMAEQFYPYLLNLLKDKKSSPELCGDHDEAKRAFYTLSPRRTVCIKGMETGYDIIGEQDATNLDDNQLQSIISTNFNEIKKCLPQSHENKKIAIYAIACGMVKLSNPMSIEPKFYTPKENPEKIEATINKIVSILNEKIKQTENEF